MKFIISGLKRDCSLHDVCSRLVGKCVGGLSAHRLPKDGGRKLKISGLVIDPVLTRRIVGQTEHVKGSILPPTFEWIVIGN
jgi:hypothetical protein